MQDHDYIQVMTRDGFSDGVPRYLPWIICLQIVNICYIERDPLYSGYHTIATETCFVNLTDHLLSMYKT